MAPRASDNRYGRTVILVVCGDVVLSSWVLPDARRVDLALIDELARLQLDARRLGCTIRLHHVAPQLLDLLQLTGLSEIVAEVPRDPWPGSGRPGCLDLPHLSAAEGVALRPDSPGTPSSATEIDSAGDPERLDPR